jgi:HK97 family phage major capsid protein
MAKSYFRAGVLEAITGKGAKRGFALSFASEYPVLRKDKRGVYWEILSHGPGDAKLGLLNREGVVFQDHDDTQEIGVVTKKSARVDTDHKTRAEIELAEAGWRTRAKADPEEIPISVGYNRMALIRVVPGADGIPERWYSWEPYEVSLLTGAPADPTVGLNRAAAQDDEAFCRETPPTVEGKDGPAARLYKRAVTHRCGRCEGTGRCACREDDDARADKDCELCEGDGDCHECEGDGQFVSARASERRPSGASLQDGVDSITDLDAAGINKQLTKKQREAMRILLKGDADDGGDNKAVLDAAVRTTTEKVSKETREATATSYKARAKEINAVVNKHLEKHGERMTKVGDKEVKLRDRLGVIAAEALESDEAIAEFKTRCLEEITASKEPVPVMASDFATREEMSQFSLIRSIQSAAKQRREGKEGFPQELEGDISKEYMKRCRESEGGYGAEPQGFIVPPDCQFGCASMTRAEAKSQFRKLVNRYGRDMQATNFGAGGAVVPTFWLLPVIELLRNKTVLNRVGMRTLAGLTGNVILPRLEAPSTAYSLAEIAAGQASQQTLGQLTAMPHRVFNEVDYSKQLVFQSSPDIEALIRDDMFQVLGLKRDILGLNGQGANSEPLGILNTPGIGTTTFGATPTYKQMVGFETTIRSLNVTGKLSYVSTSATKGSLKTVAEALTGATTIGGAQNAIWKSIGGDGEDDGVVNGCQAIDSQQIPNNQVLAGVFNHFVECMWSGLDIVVDYFTKASNAEVRVIMNLWLDFLCRHPQAFEASTDAGNQ